MKIVTTCTCAMDHELYYCRLEDGWPNTHMVCNISAEMSMIYDLPVVLDRWTRPNYEYSTETSDWDSKRSNRKPQTGFKVDIWWVCMVTSHRATITDYQSNKG